MSTLSVPPVPTSPRDDAIALYRAFKGTTLSLSLSLSLSLKFLYKHAFTTCLVQRCKSSTKKINKNMNSITRIDTNWLQSCEPFISCLSIIFGSKGLILLFGFFFFFLTVFAVYHVMCHPNVSSTNLPKKISIN